MKTIIPNTIPLKCKWDNFFIKDLFKISGTKTTSLKILRETNGNHPYVTTQATNNGIEGYYGIYTELGNVLTIDSAVGGWMTYQDKMFSASDHVEKLTPKFEMTKNIALFIVSVWNKLYSFNKYSYALKASQKELIKEKIPLPTKNNQPDWQFMENYIKSLPNSDLI